MKQDYIFIDKAVFFPEPGILAVGDLHIGYEQSIRDSGFMIPETQINELIETLKKIIEGVKSKNYVLRKLIFLGDLKHYFGYEWKEKFYFNKVADFLKKYVKDKNIILIKGNHDTFDFTGKKMENYFIESGIAFLHGHESFLEIFSNDVKTIVTGHLHPSILLTDKQNIKREKYKCFLVGKFKNKKAIVLPSFFGMIEGTAVNENYETKKMLKHSKQTEKEFSIIPKKELQKFRVYVVDGEGKVLDFGEVRKLK